MSEPTNIFTGTGRRKTSTARVRITDGSGKLIVIPTERPLPAYEFVETWLSEPPRCAIDVVAGLARDIAGMSPVFAPVPITDRGTVAAAVRRRARA